MSDERTTSSEPDGNQHELLRRFVGELTGTAPREFPHGRIGADDDGSLTYAMATDAKRGVIIMRFPKPVDWIGLDRKAAEELRDQLTERLAELRGVPITG